MSYHFQEVEEHTAIILTIRANDKQMNLGAVIEKHLSENLTHISLDYPKEKRLNFDNVQIDVLYCPGDTSPILWHNAKIVYHKNAYILQITSDGIKSNRRNSYRVPVSILGWMNQINKKPIQVMIKDVSITGFAITDRKKELDISYGERVSITFEDLIFKIDLDGQVVRIEEHDGYIIYGFMILNICKDLPVYINQKQRKIRKSS